MKKLLVCLILAAVVAGTSVSAWEATDLLTYPSCMDDDDFIMNFGVGLGNFGYIGRDYIWLPTFRLSLDKNVPLGDLPLSFGGLIGYTGHGWKGRGQYSNKYFVHTIPVGFRFGYHFNWGVDGLDTYAVTTANARFHFGHDKDHWKPEWNDWFNISFGLGARYFISDNFGFWAEIPFDLFTGYFFGGVDIGITFKF